MLRSTYVTVHGLHGDQQRLVLHLKAGSPRPSHVGFCSTRRPEKERCLCAGLPGEDKEVKDTTQKTIVHVFLISSSVCVSPPLGRVYSPRQLWRCHCRAPPPPEPGTLSWPPPESGSRKRARPSLQSLLKRELLDLTHVRIVTLFPPTRIIDEKVDLLLHRSAGQHAAHILFFCPWAPSYYRQGSLTTLQLPTGTLRAVAQLFKAHRKCICKGRQDERVQNKPLLVQQPLFPLPMLIFKGFFFFSE